MKIYILTKITFKTHDGHSNFSRLQKLQNRLITEMETRRVGEEWWYKSEVVVIRDWLLVFGEEVKLSIILEVVVWLKNVIILSLKSVIIYKK